ncbi:hypothetical protein C4546_00680 [Candidatus Parcubacteria bacterium]|jgi:protein-disulfide isomerase|nr:MAG: hypothetical protein C4546_00680 [Candidatus Parcubacteria bacterium]
MLKKENLFFWVVGALAAIVLVSLLTATIRTNSRVKDLQPQVFETDPLLGKTNAKVTVVIFTDFECEFCKAQVPILKRVLADYQNEIRLVYKEYPLPSHQNATYAASIARCAQAQNKFWQMHDVIFDNQSDLGNLDLAKLAQESQTDLNTLKACLDSKSETAKIQENLAEGQRLVITETPTIFVNERRLTGLNDETTIQNLIEEKLK